MARGTFYERWGIMSSMSASKQSKINEYYDTAPYVTSEKLEGLWGWLVTNFIDMEADLRNIIDKMQLLEQDIHDLQSELRNI